MKNIRWILIALLFTAGSQVCNAQVEHRLLDTNARWKVSTFVAGIPPSYSYQCHSDSLSSLDVSDWKDLRATMNNINYFEDTIEHKVYCTIGFDSFLLYDYSLNVGDTFFWDRKMFQLMTMRFLGDSADGYAYSVVHTRDSLTLSDNSRRLRIKLEDYFYYSDSSALYIDMFNHNLTWLDGIGATRGFFYPECGETYGYHQLYAEYLYNNQSLYKWRDCWSNGPEGLEEQSRVASLIAIYPNPARDAVTIEFELPEKIEKGKITVYTVGGRQVLTQNVTASKNHVNMDISELKGGVYLYLLTSDGEFVARRRLIVSK